MVSFEVIVLVSEQIKLIQGLWVLMGSEGTLSMGLWMFPDAVNVGRHSSRQHTRTLEVWTGGSNGLGRGIQSPSFER